MNKFFLILFLISLITIAQKEIKPSDEIKVFGMVENPFSISYSKIESEKSTEIGDFTITNHAGEFRKAYKSVKGVALIGILESLKIQSPSPKELSEFYLIFRGSDGYSVLFSWNEIYNTDIGKSIYIVTQADGKKLTESTDRILMICTKDYKTGRRHIKGLSSIEIKRI